MRTWAYLLAFIIILYSGIICYKEHQLIEYEKECDRLKDRIRLIEARERIKVLAYEGIIDDLKAKIENLDAN